MEKQLLLRILSPGGERLRAEAFSVRLPSTDGSLGILPGHAPLLALLSPGEVLYRTAEGEQRCTVSGGIAEIGGDQVLLLTEKE